MNPGVADAWTTCLPQSSASLVTAAATAGSVARPLTTSTSRITGAGLKKCRPTRRPGWLSPAAMAVGDSEDVLVASTQSGATTFSRSANRACLTARSSATASITHRAAPGSGEVNVVVVERLAVDAVARRCDPCGDLAPLVHRLHQRPHVGLVHVGG